MEKMDILAEIILQDLRTNPSNYIGEIRRHEAELIESFYYTVSDKEKVSTERANRIDRFDNPNRIYVDHYLNATSVKQTLQILEYSNFTRTYCMDPNPPALLNFPKESNGTALKELVCYLSKSVQADLELNVTNIENEETAYSQREFNWTAFNEKTIEIYQYIDSLVSQDDQDYDLAKLQNLRRDFKTSWTTNITAKAVWEIR